jgi:hypothetical protein
MFSRPGVARQQNLKAKEKIKKDQKYKEKSIKQRAGF